MKIWALYSSILLGIGIATFFTSYFTTNILQAIIGGSIMVVGMATYLIFAPEQASSKSRKIK